LSPSSPTAVTRLFRACDPSEALRYDDPRYVNCDRVRGENLARVYAQSLRLADPLRPEVKVFAGHRGVGKTSELRRLKHMLEEPDEADARPFLVLYSDVTGALDLNDLDFPDLLVFTAAEVQRQLRDAKIPGFSTSSRLLERLWDELQEALGAAVVLKDAKLDVAFAKLALELRNRPNARAELRHAIEQSSTRLVEAVNDLLLLATVKAREAGREGLVLIIDGLDKLVRRPLEGETDTHERLFIDRGDQLAGLRAHVIYTVPISLIYAPRFTQLEQTFGAHHVPIPMIRLRDARDKEIEPGSAGMRKLGEMITARCHHAEVEPARAFDDERTSRYLCRMTGGHPRHLMMFLQAALSHVGELPITRAAAEKVIRNYANALHRQMPDSYWPLLRAFAEPRVSLPRDSEHQEMLLLLHIFEYMNHSAWYEVNPVIRELSRFHAD
jgi:hypothetical protein